MKFHGFQSFYENELFKYLLLSEIISMHGKVVQWTINIEKIFAFVINTWYNAQHFLYILSSMKIYPVKNLSYFIKIRVYDGNNHQTTPRFAVACNRYATGVSRRKRAQTTATSLRPLCSVLNRWIRRLSRKPFHPMWNKTYIQLNIAYTSDFPRVTCLWFSTQLVTVIHTFKTYKERET